MPAIRRIVIGCLLALAAIAVATPGVHAQTLKTAFVEDIGVPDPDLFYAAEGLLVTNNVYEGLLRYKPDSTDIEPALAESWSVSDDGLQYTFKLRSGVKFHDGTTLSADDVIKSFDRRLAVEGLPSYMLFDIARTEAKDPLTLVVTLKAPVNAFHHFMASPYGPKIMSGAILDANKGDHAQKFLSTGDAGTGAYAITGWKVGQSYTLSAFAGYFIVLFVRQLECPIFQRKDPDRTTFSSVYPSAGMPGIPATVDFVEQNLTKAECAAFQRKGPRQYCLQ